MKNLMYLSLFAYFVATLSSCVSANGDDEPGPYLNALVPTAGDFITANYPDYSIRSAEREDLCDNTVVLEVELEDGPGPDIDLYFTLQGDFLFSATDISLTELPEAVQLAVTTDFPTYSINVNNVERLDFLNDSIQYEVELIHQVSRNEEEVVYTADGILVCFENDDDDGDDDDGDDDDGDDEDDDDGDGDDDGDQLNLPDDVRDFIQGAFPGYLLTSVEREDICDDVLMYEVELEDGPGPDLELYFDLDWVLQFTVKEINISDLPAAVTTAISTNYANYRIEEDDVKQLERPNGELMYAVNLESEDDDLELILRVDGTIYCEDE